MTKLYECQNCRARNPLGSLNYIKDLYARVEPGEPMPAGECPECGALCHAVKADDAATLAAARANANEGRELSGNIAREREQLRRERDHAIMAAKANAKECETLRGAVDNWIALAQSRGREVDHLVNQRIKLARELAGSDVRISNLIAERDELAARLSDAIRERNAMREYVRTINPTCVIE